jgi:hypothetical protein
VALLGLTDVDHGLIMGGPAVSIIMGSDSDLPTMKEAAEILELFDIPYELTVVSAHRTPSRMYSFAQNCSERGIKVSFLLSYSLDSQYFASGNNRWCRRGCSFAWNGCCVNKPSRYKNKSSYIFLNSNSILIIIIIIMHSNWSTNKNFNFKWPRFFVLDSSNAKRDSSSNCSNRFFLYHLVLKSKS